MLTLDENRGLLNPRLASRQFFGSSLRSVEIDGLSITLTRSAAARRQPWHTHENPTFFMLVRGDFVDRSPAAKSVMEPFSAVFHPTDEPHQSESGPDGSVGINIELTRHWLTRNCPEARLGPYRHLTGVESRLTCLRILIRAFSAVEPGDRRIESDALALVQQLESTPVDQNEKRAPYWLPQVEAFLHNSLDEATGLRNAAREACLHPVYVARVFREHYGCSVGEYIRRLRILRASSYAIETETNLADAAHEARFADQSHFTRLFTRETGFSPKVLLRIRAATRL